MISTLFVVDNADDLSLADIETISFDEYLRNYPKLNEPKTRVINLCHAGRYLSQGYYCSLLAEARQHQVLPSVRVLNDLRNEAQQVWLDKKALGAGFNVSDLPERLVICMGEVEDSRFQELASKIFYRIPAPILDVYFQEQGNGLVYVPKSVHWSELAETERAFCVSRLESYSQKVWHKRGKGKKFRWEIAMLVNPEEKVPPSNKGALSRFVRAGEKLGLKVHKVSAAELGDLNLYDGLFIRETTAIDHHTYRLARRAEELGLVVMDDPDSILRCCNKAFLHDAFHYKKVPSPRTEFVSSATPYALDALEQGFGFPMVLKLPEGSFSNGVFKVKDRSELETALTGMLEKSALVLAQEYLFTEFDWRIGVLNGRVFYACRYYMARNHWQIYNHESKRFFSGGFDALPTFEVPRSVLRAALKAASVVGEGLYGIDIKEVDGKAYVLEVNDNPSIDHGVEDHYLADEIYMQIMSEFERRLELRGR